MTRKKLLIILICAFQSHLALSQTDAVSEILKGITKDCPSLLSEKDVLINDILLYADQKNKVLVYLGRGNKSSDILIFDLKDNSFTGINSQFSKNNELHKISKFDSDRLPPPKSTAGCNFKNELRVTGFFNCDSKTGSFNCKWVNCCQC